MTKISDGGPAFPRVCPSTEDHDAYDTPGMSVRDYFAAKAVASLVKKDDMMNAFRRGHRDDSEAVAAREYAAFAYGIADAMLAERAKDRA